MAVESNDTFLPLRRETAKEKRRRKGVENGHRPRRGFLFFSFEGTSLNRRIRDGPRATKNDPLLPVVSSSFSARRSSLFPSLYRFISYPQRLVQDFFHSQVEIIGFLFPPTRALSLLPLFFLHPSLPSFLSPFDFPFSLARSLSDSTQPERVFFHGFS